MNGPWPTSLQDVEIKVNKKYAVVHYHINREDGKDVDPNELSKIMIAIGGALNIMGYRANGRGGLEDEEV